MAANALPVHSGDKDTLLQQALTRLHGAPKPGGAEADAIVTATRRLPALPASYAPFPAEADPRLLTALAARGIDRLYTHQAEAFGHVLAGRNERCLYKMVCDEGTGRILGIHMIGPESAEIMQAAAVAVKAGLTKEQFDQTVAIHPTMAEELVLLR